MLCAVYACVFVCGIQPRVPCEMLLLLQSGEVMEAKYQDLY
jgi:hypothetical protein